MVTYNNNEKAIIDHFNTFRSKEGLKWSKYEQYRELIPMENRRYKCHTCFAILSSDEVIDGKCKYCGEEKALAVMCPIDHNGCGHEISGSIEYCPVCGEPVCPECGDHNVVTISRVTGYMSDVAGWNNAKRAELKDRVRSNLNLNNEMIKAAPKLSTFN